MAMVLLNTKRGKRAVVLTSYLVDDPPDGKPGGVGSKSDAPVPTDQLAAYGGNIPLYSSAPAGHPVGPSSDDSGDTTADTTADAAPAVPLVDTPIGPLPLSPDAPVSSGGTVQGGSGSGGTPGVPFSSGGHVQQRR